MHRSDMHHATPWLRIKPNTREGKSPPPRKSFLASTSRPATRRPKLCANVTSPRAYASSPNPKTATPLIPHPKSSHHPPPSKYPSQQLFLISRNPYLKEVRGNLHSSAPSSSATAPSFAASTAYLRAACVCGGCFVGNSNWNFDFGSRGVNGRRWMGLACLAW
ncbi:hypothetical protein CC86DRAFT_97958 [Ophiobolus disseminans]|uniref:Uncharacterized protein n=1 Tax=Ophiobolus disseminans TaxID=1469910 RepID=A0A6A6ZME7_9PLEO|nr:hypothetical protein CC86DRAFT_97958 [Ophiobolus disseminans]